MTTIKRKRNEYSSIGAKETIPGRKFHMGGGYFDISQSNVSILCMGIWRPKEC
jgi:hypothetical protein